MVASEVLPLEPDDPALVGGYRLRGRLGEGGMGVVYLAGGPDDHVAIKTMRAADIGDVEARARFSAEAACARNLECDHIPRVLLDGSDAASPYLVTEHIDGRSLAQAVQADGPLSVFGTLSVAIAVADGLAQIHEAGIVHRDIKPSNILLGKDGPRIIDFGIAHRTDSQANLTRTGMVMGSPGWVAPERLRGGRATPASDVFGWGLLVAYAATGRHPFGPAQELLLAERILSLAPDLGDLGDPLRELVATALAKDPSARPTAVNLRRELFANRNTKIAPLPVEDLWKSSRPVHSTGRRRMLLPAAVIVAALGLGLLSPSEGPHPQAQMVVTTTPGPVVTVTRTAVPPSSPSHLAPSSGGPSAPSTRSAVPENPATGQTTESRQVSSKGNGKSKKSQGKKAKKAKKAKK